MTLPEAKRMGLTLIRATRHDTTPALDAYVIRDGTRETPAQGLDDAIRIAENIRDENLAPRHP